MTIAHYTLGDGYGNLVRRIRGMGDDFWVEVRKNVVSWAIIGAIGGVGWLSMSVPSRLDRVLLNQEGFQSELRSLKGELSALREAHETRLNRLEMSK